MSNQRGNPNWIKGVSGNPKGRPVGLPDDVKELLKAACPDAIKTIIELSKNSGDLKVRLAAATNIVDRVYGKAAQPIGGTEELPPIVHQIIKQYEYYTLDNQTDKTS